MVRPGEAFGRIALASKEIGLPGAIRGDAGDLINLGLIGDRIGGVGGRRRKDQNQVEAPNYVRGEISRRDIERGNMHEHYISLQDAEARLQASGKDAIL